MGNFKYAMSMLKKDMTQCIFYILSMCCSITVLINMFNILFNEEFTSRVDSDFVVYSLLACILLVVAIIFIVFANLYFIYSKTKEFAIIVLSGRSVHELGFIILLQNIFLGIIGGGIGILLGITALPLTNSIVYKSMGMEPNLWYVSELGIAIVASILVMEFIMMVLVDMGYVYRREIAQLVRETNEGYQVDNRSVKVKPIIYCIAYILPIVVPIILPVSLNLRSGLALLLLLPSIVSVQGLIRNFIPDLIIKLKERVFAYNKVMLMALSNLHYSIRKAGLLIVTLIVSIFILAFLILIKNDQPYIQVICLITCIVTIILLAITIVYKMLIEITSRKKVFKQFSLLGYTKKEIAKIIRAEVVCFFGIVILVPGLQFGVLFTFNVLTHQMDLNYAIYILSTLIGVYLLAGIVAYIAYRKIIKNYMKSF